MGNTNISVTSINSLFGSSLPFELSSSQVIGTSNESLASLSLNTPPYNLVSLLDNNNNSLVMTSQDATSVVQFNESEQKIYKEKYKNIAASGLSNDDVLFRDIF